MQQIVHLPRSPPTPPVLMDCFIQTIEDGISICSGGIIEYMVHDSGLVPVIFMDEYPGAHKLGREDLGSKIKIQSPNRGDIGIIWTENPDILLPKFAGTTPSLNTFGFRVRGKTSIKVRLVERIPIDGGFATRNWKWRFGIWIVDNTL